MDTEWIDYRAWHHDKKVMIHVSEIDFRKHRIKGRAKDEVISASFDEAEQEAASKQAEANRILGESIRQYPESMEQKWVEAIEKTSNQVIYLPTEASVPITESARMAQKATAGK